MALCKTIEDREFAKFVEDGDGNHAIRVVVADGTVEAKRIDHADVTINSTGWSELTTGAVDRLGINVQNNTGVEMKILFSLADPGGVYRGMSIKAGAERQYAQTLEDGYKAWGRFKSGGSAAVDVEEIRA